MTETRTGWKVVHEEYYFGDLRSAVVSNTGTVYYKVGEWTVPQPDQGPLAVFGSFEEARRFVVQHIWDRSSIYKCIYTPSQHTEMWITNGLGIKIGLPLSEAPMGTVLADRVKPLKKVSLR